MTYALVIALYAGLVLYGLSVPVLLFLILRKLSVCEQTEVDSRGRMFGMSKHGQQREQQEQERSEVRLLRRIVELLEQFLAAKSLNLTQEGVPMGVITGIKPGATATFALSTLPVGSLLQAGSIPSYVSDNAVDVSALVPAADGLSFSVTGAATFAAKSFNVTAGAISLDGTKLSQVFNIPLLAPAGVPATGLDLNQTA
jgi:hypothetical protein